MSKTEWMPHPLAKGGGLWVETMELIPRAKAKATKRGQEFVLLPLRRAADMAKATGTL